MDSNQFYQRQQRKLRILRDSDLAIGSDRIEGNERCSQRFVTFLKFLVKLVAINYTRIKQKTKGKSVKSVREE